MPTQVDTKLSAREFAERFRQEMVPLNNSFAWFSALPLPEEDVKEYLDEPIAALPPALQTHLPKISILLVPFLEKTAGKPGSELVTFEKPPARNQAWSAQFELPGTSVLIFAIKDQQSADYHYAFYRGIATLLAEHATEAQNRFFSLVREELRGNVHGEVDEIGWELKQALVRRQTDLRRETKLFRGYARQAFIDTLTLYLHGICCDIDVETGPRQLASRHLRRRLQIFHDAFPPPSGYAVFPEELNKA